MMTAEEWHDFKINAVEAQESQYLKLCYEAGALGLVDLCQELFRVVAQFEMDFPFSGLAGN